jgi:hypothetical protein
MFADVIWYGPRSKNAAAFAGRARLTYGPANSWAGFFRLAAKTKDLRLFHDLPPIGGNCSNFRPSGVLGWMGGMGLARAANFIVGPRRLANSRQQKTRRITTQIPTQHPLNMRLPPAKVLNSPIFMRQAVAVRVFDCV